MEAAETREHYEIEIYTNINGTSTYVLGVALADIINKYSTWLRATAMESPGPNETAMMLINEPTQQTRAIGYLITQDALLGYPPYNGPNEDLRNLAAYGLVCNLYMTTNSELRTLKDLDGKRVALGTRPNIPRVDMQEKIFENLGVKPVYEYLPFNDAVTALSDGKIDALVGGGFAISAAADKWIPNPAMAELLARTKIYYISMEGDSLWRAKTELNHMLLPGVITVPAGKFDANWNQPVTLQADYLCWASHKNMPDDVVTEILTQMADHADEFANYIANGAYISAENMAKMDMPEWVHPAAEAFYKSRGIEINYRDK
jgi:TRAP transporter TAXI family solute receptor